MRIWLSAVVLGAALAMSPIVNAGTVEPSNADFDPAPALKDNLAVRAIVDKTKTSRIHRNKPERADYKALHTYYSEKVERPIWFTAQGGLNERAKSVIDEFAKADDWGLSAKDFLFPERVTKLLENHASGSTLSDNDVADIEIAISLLALKYARHARGGRIPDPASQLSSYLDRKPKLLDPAIVLDGLRNEQAADRYLVSLHPKHSQFKKLRKKLLEMRNGDTQEQKPEDIKLPASGPILRKDSAHADVALLRKRLSVPVTVETGTTDSSNRRDSSSDDDLKPDLARPEEFFDQKLEDAVLAFQKENNLSADGLVGRGTRRALNGASQGALSEEVLLANMEQWRWMPDDLGKLHINVNIPEYRIRVFKNDLVVHEERAIVGKTNKQTPVFSDTMKTIVVHPNWGVPNSIKVRELLPSLTRGGQSFRRQGLRIRKNGRDINPDSINWNYEDIRKYDVYQPPGRSNVLGVIKFMFPNKHQVYMHDTPTKNLFNKTVRTYSHGCMRLRNPLRLAEIIFAEDKDWNPKEVLHLIKQGPQNNHIKLDTPIPVHMTYFTAVADEDGSVRRLRDVYGHEKRIKLALAGKFSQIARGRNHLAPVRLTRPKTTYQPITMNDIFQNVFGGF